MFFGIGLKNLVNGRHRFRNFLDQYKFPDPDRFDKIKIFLTLDCFQYGSYKNSFLTGSKMFVIRLTCSKHGKKNTWLIVQKLTYNS